MDEVLSIEAVLKRTDTSGRYQLPRYQLRLLLLCGAQWYVSTSLTMLPTFVTARIEVDWDMSTVSSSLVLGSAFFFGNLVGIFGFGIFMDVRGRRAGIILALAIASLAGPATSVCPGPATLACVRALSGLAAGGAMCSPMVLLLEFAPPSRRATLKALLTTLGWSCNLIVFIGLVYSVRDCSWRLTAVAFIPVPLLLALSYHATPESPRYLLGAGREEAAIAILRRVAAANQQPLPDGLRLDDGSLKTQQDGSSSHPASAPGGHSLTPSTPWWRRALRKLSELCHPSLRLVSLLVGVGFVCSSGGYYAVALASDLGGDLDVYLQQLLGALIELPSYLSIPILADRIGRSRTWALMLLGAAVPLLTIGLFTNEGLGDAFGLALALAARFCIAASATINYVAAAEQFPTSSRAVGMSFASTCGRLGTLASPQIANALNSQAHNLVLGGVTAVGALAVLCLPETLGVPMAERVVGVGVRCRERVRPVDRNAIGGGSSSAGVMSV